MASQKYLTKDGLEKIASYVNEKSKIVSLTKAQYDALTETQKKDEHIIYNITDMDAPGTVPIKYYENADDYYNLTDAQKEAIEELVIVNDDEGEPLSADNVSCQDAEGVLTNVQSVVDEITSDISSLNDTITKITKTQTNTEEKIGKYAGNDLYRQRFSGQLSGTTKQISTITTNQIQIVSAKGTINTSDYSAQMPLNSYWDNSWNNGMIINSAGTYINVCSTLSNGYYDVTLEYIKK